MEFKFIHYPKCTTCQKAKKWLDDHNVTYEPIHIVENNPTKEEIKSYLEISGLPLKRFFNTSGIMYKEMNLKDKLQNMSEEEQIELLSSNGMLVKRPLLVSKDTVLVGFKEKEWLRLLEGENE